MLPDQLLQAIAHPSGGRVVLVVGAGCSVEPPTNLPLANDCASEVHRQLIADGILNEGDCPDPSDLSVVADTIISKTGSQTALVARLPLERFKLAEPNEGYLLAAAMLREGALTCVMTLNYDLAMHSALVQVGAGENVSVISGPEDHNNLGFSNLIFLHRNVNAAHDRWIISSNALNTEWENRWEEVIVRRVISAPIVVFIGLGTPASVLLECTNRIREAIPTGVGIYQIDQGRLEDSAFFMRLNLPKEAFIQMGWCSFMGQLSSRLVEEQRAKLEHACNDLISTEGWETEDISSLCSRIRDLGLLRLGQLRARWLLCDNKYEPQEQQKDLWLADLLLTVGLVERCTSSQAHFHEDGIVEFRRGNQIIGIVIVAHGRGYKRWLTLDSAIEQNERHWRHRNPRPIHVIVSGTVGEEPSHVAPPSNVTTEEKSDDIITGITGTRKYYLISADKLRREPSMIGEIIT